MAKIVIYGAGAVAEMAHHYFDTDSEHEVVGFVVDAAYLKSDEFRGLPCTAAEEAPSRYSADDYAMFVGMGYAKMSEGRAKAYAWAKGQGYRLPSYVSSRCSYLSEHAPGENTLIMEDNTVQPFVRIGNNVVMWSGNHVGHYAEIGDHCFLTSHVVVSGYCKVGERCFLGVNAALRDDITLAPRTLVGMGVSLTHDTEEGDVYLAPKAVKASRKSDAFDI